MRSGAGLGPEAGKAPVPAECVDSDVKRLQVLPFYHTGTDVLQPTSPTSQQIFSRPNFGCGIHVIFGEPVDLTHLLALRATPPFDRRPELLYEVIAHTLEEEVRSLRGALHRKLGISPTIPREGGCFDVDAAVLHPDALIARRAREEMRKQGSSSSSSSS